MGIEAPHKTGASIIITCDLYKQIVNFGSFLKTDFHLWKFAHALIKYFATELVHSYIIKNGVEDFILNVRQL